MLQVKQVTQFSMDYQSSIKLLENGQIDTNESLRQQAPMKIFAINGSLRNIAYSVPSTMLARLIHTITVEERDREREKKKEREGGRDLLN